MSSPGIFLNAFTRLTLDGIVLGEMQIANPRFVYALPDADESRARIECRVRLMSEETSTLAKWLFQSDVTGYFLRDQGYYYRNCNIVNDMRRPDIFYKGWLPNSMMRVRLSGRDPVVIDVEATKAHVWESRSRLTRISSIDQAVNNILLAVSVLCGHLPMHAAAIDIPRETGRSSILFMGLPNTGKTTTSVALRKALQGEYLSEDICFVDPETMKVFGGPFTFDETKIQDYDNLKATRFTGAPLRELVILQRTPDLERQEAIAPGSVEVAAFLIDMNRYEFEWNHDLFVRHLMIGGADMGFTSSRIAELYLGGLHRIAGQINAIRLSGTNPERWKDDLLKYIQSTPPA